MVMTFALPLFDVATNTTGPGSSSRYTCESRNARFFAITPDIRSMADLDETPHLRLVGNSRDDGPTK
jgi:hypothetical protein